MGKTYMLYRGPLARILVKEPGCGEEVRSIPGDPSANNGPQDDSVEFMETSLHKIFPLSAHALASISGSQPG